MVKVLEAIVPQTARRLALTVFLALAVCCIPHVAVSLELTPEQLKLIANLSPEERAKLASQAGLSANPNTKDNTATSSEPVTTIKPRELESGPLEMAPLPPSLEGSGVAGQSRQ